jgi:hypothetical protein
MNGTHQLLVYADYVNLLGKNKHRTQKLLLDSSKRIGLEVNKKKTKSTYEYSKSCHHDAGKNHYININ